MNNYHNLDIRLKVYSPNVINSYIYGIIQQKECIPYTIRERTKFCLNSKCYIYNYIHSEEIKIKNETNFNFKNNPTVYNYNNIDIIKNNTKFIPIDKEKISIKKRIKKIKPIKNKVKILLSNNKQTYPEISCFSVYKYIKGANTVKNKSSFTGEIEKIRFARVEDILELTIDDIINNDMTIEDLIIKKD